MNIEELQKGDTIYTNCHIYNDGSIPTLAENALIAQHGTRGLIVETGYLEDTPERKIYLVRFEDQDLELGPPTGCWLEELSVTGI